MNRVVAEVTAWSLKHAASGTAPQRGFYGEEFNRKSYRFSMAGKEMAGGYRKLVCASICPLGPCLPKPSHL